MGDVGSLKKKRSLTPDVLKGSSQRLESLSESENTSLGDNHSQGGPSPISTPMFGKRKNVNDRKLRPKSIVDSGEGYSQGPGELQLSLCILSSFPQVVLCNSNFVTRS